MPAKDKYHDSVKQTLQGYTGRGIIGRSYLTTSIDETFFTVTTVADNGKKRLVNHSLTVHLTGETIIIEEDFNDKPLVDALMQAGIPRDNIILAYAGEKVPETA